MIKTFTQGDLPAGQETRPFMVRRYLRCLVAAGVSADWATLSDQDICDLWLRQNGVDPNAPTLPL